jgi:uncharacterized protein YheU (UPF0270 family)
MDHARGIERAHGFGAPDQEILDLTEDQSPALPPIVVPYTELSADALTGVIESFVLREGTDYGERDVPFETKVLQVRRQLERREAEIVFDPDTESIDIIVRKPSAR